MNNKINIQPKYTESQIEKFQTEDDFMDASVELLKQTIELIFRVVGENFCEGNEGMPKKISKDEAVVAGNLTRLIKLNTSFLENICNGKSEICYIINRCIAETCINLKYILIEGEERVKRNYIKNSLITEKELWKTIITNIKENDGEVLPIEDRMKKSIQNSFDKSDFEIDDVNRSSNWKSLKARAEVVAGKMFYDVYYGIASHSIHGNWQDILTNNLEKVDDGFKIKLDWQKPRPQLLDRPTYLNLDIITLYNEKEIQNLTLKRQISEICISLKKYHLKIEETHEKWMSIK
jgi:hypothetical protein